MVAIPGVGIAALGGIAIGTGINYFIGDYIQSALDYIFHIEHAEEGEKEDKPANHPSRDSTGRCHDPLTDPEDLPNEEFGESIREIEQSIDQRKREMYDHARRGDVDELPGHSEKARRERNWLKRAERVWGDRAW